MMDGLIYEYNQDLRKFLKIEQISIIQNSCEQMGFAIPVAGTTNKSTNLVH
jgi:hypothetical protein